MITESQIKAAVRRVTAGGTQRLELKDNGERGAGRLALIVRRLGDKVATEWYAIYYRGGKRALSKVGSYPTMSLADARKKFREEYAPVISAGAEPESAAARRTYRKEAGKLGELFAAYVENLRTNGHRSAKKAGHMLSAAANAIGADRVASKIEAKDIVPHLAGIHDRGARAQAKQVRAYISAAFSFGMKAENDYRQKSAGATWSIKSNPVMAIPTDYDASPPRNRFLTPSEFRTLWLWLVDYQSMSRMASVLLILLATGQRIEEILRITASPAADPVYDRPKRMLYWEKTKNRLPHSIPLPPQACDVLDSLLTNTHGIYFPNRRDATRFSLSESVHAVTEIFLREHPEFAHFIPKDVRRTFKTLAGDAGVSKEMRDRLQNHAKKADISSRHYDRYDYLPERRAAVAKWAAYLDLVIAGEIKEIGQRESNVVPIGKGAAL